MVSERERAPLRRQANQGVEAMAEQMEKHKAGNRVYTSKNPKYNEVSAELKAQALDNAITQQQELLNKAEKRGKIDLNDLEAVKKACSDYLESCRRAGVYPSMTGLAPSMGISRQALYGYIARNNSPSANYLDSVRSAMSAIVEQAGLTRVASEAMAIFILKNTVDMADKLDVTAAAPEPDKFDKMSDEEFLEWIKAEYLLDDEDTTSKDGTIYVDE